MKRYPLLLCLSLLAACQPTAAPPSDPPTAQPAAAPATAQADAPAAPSVDAAAAPASVVDDHTEVNQRMTMLFHDPAPYEAAIMTFQRAIREHDAKTVADMMYFPFDTRHDGKVRKVADAEEFIRDYDAIVTADMTRVIANHRYDELHTDSGGIMFGNGEAWLEGICVDDACKEVKVMVKSLLAPDLPATN